jgi:signal recognition particle receptor subunit beta
MLPTHASLQTNASFITLPETNRKLRVIDIPGHPRIRHQYRDHFAESKAVVFVIDASTISRTGAVVAEHLHQVLHTFMSLPPSQPSPALLILAHKCDLLTSTSSSGPSNQLAVNRVRTVLERELEKRKESQAGGMGVESLGGEGDASELGGLECNGSGNGIFRFSDWDGGEIVFLGTSVAMKEGAGGEKSTGGGEGLGSLQRWLGNLP